MRGAVAKEMPEATLETLQLLALLTRHLSLCLIGARDQEAALEERIEAQERVCQKESRRHLRNDMQAAETTTKAL